VKFKVQSLKFKVEECIASRSILRPPERSERDSEGWKFKVQSLKFKVCI